jgi:hypothetical protein
MKDYAIAPVDEPEQPRDLKRGLRLALSSKSLAAKCLLRFSFAGPTVWESRAVSGGRC